MDENDPFIHCLRFILKLNGRSISTTALRSYIPESQEKITPGQFVDAAEKMGLQANFIKRPLEEISPLAFPTLLLLKKGDACVLIKRNDKTATIFLGVPGSGVSEIPLEELQVNYAGAAIYVKKKYAFDSRAEQGIKVDRSKNWFWGTFWRFKDLYLKVFAGSILINLFVLASPLFIMNVYDRVIPNKAFETLWVLTIGFFIVISFDVILKLLRSYFVDIAGKKADIIVSSELLEHTLNASMESQPASVGVRANHIKEFESIREFFSSATIATFVDLPFILLFILMIRILGGDLYLFPLVGVIAVIVIAAALSFPLYHAIKNSYLGAAQKNAVLVEALSGIEEIKTTSAQPYFLEKWQRFTTIASNALLESRLYYSLTNTITVYSMSIVTIGVVVYGVYRITLGEMTTGALIACTILSSRAMAPLGQITGLLNRYKQASCSLEALNKLMAEPVEREPEKQYTPIESIKGDIRFNHVSFRYPDQKFDVFENLNLHIPEGQKVAFLGNLGSGKSTLLKLIEGLYAPTKGTITIDGIDIRQIDSADLRRHIGYISQRPGLFHGTARSNILFKAPYADDADITRAINITGADHFIHQHPDGLGMPIGEGGKGLSGGQIQMIALSRTFLLDPTLLLLDEPTSSLDSLAEQKFIEKLKEHGKGKTILFVTHKKGMLSLADRIIVVHQGKIVKDGPRDQIIQEIEGKENAQRR